MPLSTSNSNARLTPGKWRGAWLLAAIAVLILLTGWEFFWRTRGFSPVVQDDWALWAVMRRSVDKPKSIALIGSSRILLGLNPDVYQKATGMEPKMLAIDGSSPLPVLKHLSTDEQFQGTVICSLIPMFLASHIDLGRSEKWLLRFKEQKWSSRVEIRLQVFVQQHFAFRYTALLPSNLVKAFAAGRWPEPPYAPMQANRYRPAYFSRTDAKEIRQQRVEREKELHQMAQTLGPETFLKRVERIDQMARSIQQRGGKVFFVRFPSSGAVWRLEQKSWPRNNFWDVFADHTSARTIHFKDYPGLSGFKCPDGSHLSAGDAIKFTRRLAQIIMANSNSH